MTVAVELASGRGRLEYFLTIEGVGWPYSGFLSDLSTGFAGDIFTTADQDGDLGAQLAGTDTPTIHRGLGMPDSFGDSMDPIDCTYSPSGLSINIQDQDDWWLGNCTPRKESDYTTELSSAVAFFDTTIRLAVGTNFAEGDLIWVGGRECIKLGTKAGVGGTVYDYTGSVRGYLGTRRGSVLRRPEDYCLRYWPAATSVQQIPWWWWDRKVALWAHVPGEAAANCQLVWVGKLRAVTNPQSGINWKLNCTGDFKFHTNAVRRAIDWKFWSNHLAGENSDALYTNTYGKGPTIMAAAHKALRKIHFSAPAVEQIGGDGTGAYELANAYAWRIEPGGLEGMVSSWDGGGVQAADIGSETDCLYSFIDVDGSVYRLIRKEVYGGATNHNEVLGDLISYSGESKIADIPGSESGGFITTLDTSLSLAGTCRFLLDNMGVGRERNRFTVSQWVRNHPLMVGLMFMLSCDREMWRGDSAAGCTSTVLQFAASSFVADSLIGYALFCMEGDYKGQSRLITDNTTNTITVEGGFSGAPAASKEFQVRNSIYDVLPLGWGMGIDVKDVDLDSFLEVKNHDIPHAHLGKFILGVQDEIDLWQLVQDYCFKPYGVFTYFDFTSRQLSAKHIGATAEDGIFEDYVAIASSQIRDKGTVKQQFTRPIGSITLKVRAVEERIVGLRDAPIANQSVVYGTGAVSETAKVPALLTGKTRSIILRSEEANLAFAENELDKIEIEALLNTEDDCDTLIRRLLGMLGERSVPPPIWTTKLSSDLYLDLTPGQLVTIDWNTPDAPANPFEGTRGWNSVIGRVRRRNHPRRGATEFDVEIELLKVNLIGRIAPAVIVTAKGSDGNGAYFDLATTESFVADQDNDHDWAYFAVDDVVEHRDENGAAKAAWTNRAITGFGTNFASTPGGATGARIYVDGAIGSTVAAGDYLTFADWSESNSRMRKYSAYADGTTLLLSGDFVARRYGG